MRQLRVLLAATEKLEAEHGVRVRRFPYVIRTSDPSTEAERAQMRANALAGKPFMRIPHRPASMDEWMKRYAIR